MNAEDISLARPPPRAVSAAQLAARRRGFQVSFLNRLIRRNEVADLIQLGGDGRLLRRLRVGACACVQAAPLGAADLALSVDVVDRLAADGEFNGYIRELFGAARRYVVIHGRDNWPDWAGGAPARRFTSHASRYFPAWRLAAQVPNPLAGAVGDFFVYAREGVSCVIPVMPFI